MKPLTKLLQLIQSWFSFRLTNYYLIHLALLVSFAWMAMGFVGIVMAFWIVLLWFSAWQRPMRPEFFLIAAFGLLSAILLLPPGLWDNVPWLFGFLLVAASPLIDFIFPTFRDR
jgi:hypothetical protein